MKKRAFLNLSLRRLVAAVSTASMCAVLTPATTMAGTTTPAIIANTAKAALSCVSYSVEGVCFFLSCGWTGCWIRTSIKISHYVPDVVVSTYNEPLRHPWTDIGTVVATTLTTAGSALTGRLLDSSAGGLDSNSAMANFKGADAIGNPAGMFASMLASGGMFTMPKSIAFPTVSELAKFPSKELPNIGRQWTQVPASIAETVASDAKGLLSSESLLASLGTILKTIEGVKQVMEIAETVQQIQAGIAGLQQLSEILSGSTGGALFCPGGASYFNLHFQSELDAPFWRGIVPVEMIYPQAWVPGLGEIGSGYTQTWGNLYPRTGEIIQSHPVKASAVLAERVASIIYKEAQPHIYSRVQPSGGYRYFNYGEKRKWQMLYPQAWSGCQQFGQNDSLSLTSFGDGATSSDDGYAWNLWQKYTCCRRRGVYLYSVP